MSAQLGLFDTQPGAARLKALGLSPGWARRSTFPAGPERLCACGYSYGPGGACPWCGEEMREVRDG